MHTISLNSINNVQYKRLKKHLLITSSFFVYSDVKATDLSVTTDASQCQKPSISTTCGSSATSIIAPNILTLTNNNNPWTSLQNPIYTAQAPIYLTKVSSNLGEYNVDSSSYYYESSEDDVRLVYIAIGAVPQIQTTTITTTKEIKNIGYGDYLEDKDTKNFYYLAFNSPYFIFKAGFNINTVNDLLSSRDWDGQGNWYPSLSATDITTSSLTKTFAQWFDAGGYKEDGTTNVYIGWCFGTNCYSTTWPPLPNFQRYLFSQDSIDLGYVKVNGQYYTQKQSKSGSSPYTTDYCADNLDTLESSTTAILSDSDRDSLKTQLSKLVDEILSQAKEQITTDISEEQGIVTSGNSLYQAYLKAITLTGLSVLEDTDLANYLKGLSDYARSGNSSLTKASPGTIFLLSDALYAIKDRLSKTSLTTTEQTLILNTCATEFNYLEISKKISSSFLAESPKDTSPQTDPRSALMLSISDSSVGGSTTDTNMRKAIASIIQSMIQNNTASIDAITQSIANNLFQDNTTRTTSDPTTYLKDAILGSIYYSLTTNDTYTKNFKLSLLKFISTQLQTDGGSETFYDSNLYLRLRDMVSNSANSTSFINTIKSVIKYYIDNLYLQQLKSNDFKTIYLNFLKSQMVKDSDLDKYYTQLIIGHLETETSDVNTLRTKFIDFMKKWTLRYTANAFSNQNDLVDSFVSLTNGTSSQDTSKKVKAAFSNLIKTSLENGDDDLCRLIWEAIIKSIDPNVDLSDGTYLKTTMNKFLPKVLEGSSPTSTSFSEAVYNAFLSGLSNQSALDSALSTVVKDNTSSLNNSLTQDIIKTYLKLVDATGSEKAKDAIARIALSQGKLKLNASASAQDTFLDSLTTYIANNPKDSAPLLKFLNKRLKRFHKDPVVLALADYFPDRDTQVVSTDKATFQDATESLIDIASLNTELSTSTSSTQSFNAAILKIILDSMNTPTSSKTNPDKTLSDYIYDLTSSPEDYDTLSKGSLDLRPSLGDSTNQYSTISKAILSGIDFAKNILTLPLFTLTDATLDDIKSQTKTKIKLSISIKSIIDTIKADLNFSRLTFAQQNILIQCILFELQKVSCSQLFDSLLSYDPLNDPVASTIGDIMSQNYSSNTNATEAIRDSFKPTLTDQVLLTVREDIRSGNTGTYDIKTLMEKFYLKVSLT